MRRKQVQIWVDPDFKKMIKMQAASEDLKVVDLTRKWAAEKSVFNNFVREKDEVKRFKFKI